VPFGVGEALVGERLEEGGAVVLELVVDDGVDVVLDGAVGERAPLRLEIEQDEFGFDEGVADASYFRGASVRAPVPNTAAARRSWTGWHGGEDVADGDDLAVDDGGIAVEQDAVDSALRRERDAH
jgi:hypothetical protein